jgi:O-antigen ligase
MRSSWRKHPIDTPPFELPGEPSGMDARWLVAERSQDQRSPTASSNSGKDRRREGLAKPIDRSSWHTTLLTGIVIALLLLTGFLPSLIPWNVSVLIAGGFILMRLVMNRWPFPKPDALMLLALGSSVIAAIQLASNQTSCNFCTLTGLQFWAGTLAFLPLFWIGISSKLQEPHIVQGFALSAGVIFAVALGHGLYDVYYPQSEESTPFWAPFVYRSHLVALVIVALPFLLWNALWRGRHQVIPAVSSVLGAAGVVASGSRAGVALLVTEIALFGMLTLRGTPHQRRLWGVGALLLLLVAAIGLGGTEVLEHRLAFDGSLLEGRLDYWSASVQMILEQPWLGWGFGTWPDVYRQFMLYDNGLVANRAHSDWLEWTAEGGIVVGGLLLYLLIRCGQAALRHPWALGLPLLLIHGAVDYTLRQPLVWAVSLILWLAATATAPIRRRCEAPLSATPRGPS